MTEKPHTEPMYLISESELNACCKGLPVEEEKAIRARGPAHSGAQQQTQTTEESVIYCPHCGTNSSKNTIRIQEEYREFSIVTCYNCGKDHIRFISPMLLSLVRNKKANDAAIAARAISDYLEKNANCYEDWHLKGFNDGFEQGKEIGNVQARKEGYAEGAAQIPDPAKYTLTLSALREMGADAELKEYRKSCIHDPVCQWLCIAGNCPFHAAIDHHNAFIAAQAAAAERDRVLKEAVEIIWAFRRNHVGMNPIIYRGLDYAREEIESLRSQPETQPDGERK